MLLEKPGLLLNLNAHNFRNIAAMSLELSPKLNLFVGDNGHGKTNCLEAIALACSLKPLQTLANRDLIADRSEQAQLSAQFSDFALTIAISALGKKASLDGKPIKSALSLIDRRPIVFFIPEELLMIRGAKALRRRALDGAALSFNCGHLASLKAYDKILAHRNRLLKSWPVDQEMLASFSELLIKEGALIMHQRLKALATLRDHFAACLSDILGFSYRGSLSYMVDEQSIESYSEGDLMALLYENSRQCKNAEMARRVSLFGPHLDDIGFFLNGLNAKSHASRGQMRAIVLAFKLAQMRAVHEIRHHAPLVILDDIVSELDDEKKANLIDVIKKLDAQAFFSATSLHSFGASPPDLKVFSVRHGEII